MTFLVTYDCYGMLVSAWDETDASIKATAQGMACIGSVNRVRCVPGAMYNRVMRRGL